MTDPPPDPVGTLAASALFQHLGAKALRRTAEAFVWAIVPGGEDLVRVGEPGEALYLVVSGRLHVELTDSAGAEWTIREVGRGENVGELSLLTDAPRSATVRAVRDTHVGVLTRGHFEQLLRTEPEAALALTRMLAAWIQNTNEALTVAGTPATVATIALHPADGGVPVTAFAERFVEALAAIGPTRRLRAGDLDDALGPGAADLAPGAPGHAEASRWLAEQETASEFVVYEADTDRPAWTSRCLRQADRLLTLVWAGPDPTARVTPAGLAGVPERLVVLHPSGTATPHDTQRFGPEPFDGLNHVRMDRASDFDRLARHVTGRAVGLVLGGGGARGFAHIGVIAALQEAGIPIDYIGGSSMGAVIGALFAQEFSVEALVAESRLWAKYRPDKDYTAPVVALLSGRKGRAMLKEMFGDRRIEDLWRPYFAVTADLVHAETVVHRTGELARWLEAGISIPGIAPPYPTEDGRLLVDGGVLNNLPTDVMQHLGGGPVVAVDVSAKSDFSLAAWSGMVPSAYDILRDRMRGQQRPYPDLVHLLMRSSTISSIRRNGEARRDATLYLEPPVQAFDLFGWDRIDALVEVGQTYTADRLAGWDRLPDFALA